MLSRLSEFFVLFALLFIAIGSNAAAASDNILTPKQNAIFHRVLAGELNNSIHKEFWSLFTNEQIDDARQMQDQLVEFHGLAILWQKEVWKSVRDSYRSQTISKSVGYETFKKKISASGLGDIGIKNAEKMIALASLHENMQQPQGILALTDETAETVLINLESGFSRIKKLFNPDWRFEVDNASANAYAAIVSKQPTWQKKSTACFRFWDILDASMSLGLQAKLDGKGAKPTKKQANSVFNVKWRRNFIDLVIKKNNLQQLRDEAYAYGAGVDLMDKKNPQIIKDICVKGINSYLKQNKDMSQQAMQLANEQMNEFKPN